MNIRVHIDRLVLEDIPFNTAGTPDLQAALERRLGELLTGGGLSTELQNGGTLRALRGGNLPLQAGARAGQLGEGIANAVYEGIGQRER